MTSRIIPKEEWDSDLEAELVYERESEYNESLQDDAYSLEEMAAQELEWMWRE